MVEIKSVKLDEFFKILTQVNKIDDVNKNKRYSHEIFLKYGETPDIHQLQYVMFDDGKPVAGCVVHMHCLEFGYAYINELQSFISGHNYGAMLLRLLNVMNSKLWLCRSWDKPELDKYYEQFTWLNKADIKCGQHKTSVYYKNCNKEILIKAFK